MTEITATIAATLVAAFLIFFNLELFVVSSFTFVDVVELFSFRVGVVSSSALGLTANGGGAVNFFGNEILREPFANFAWIASVLQYFGIGNSL